MNEQISGIALVLGLGIGAQWLAWRLRLPSILLLLATGVIAGPVTGVIDPDALFGELLLPAVSLGVAVILFEGGLSLHLSDLRRGGTVVWRLVTAGVAVTWVLATLAAYWLTDLGTELALLFGALLVVTGPTVIVPLLRQLGLKPAVASILRWEGMLNDPLGAILAVLVFEGILTGSIQHATAITLLGLAKSLVIGAAIGAILGIALAFVLGRYYVPDYLQNPATLAAVGATYVIADTLQPESGLLAVTLMGAFLAWQRWVPVRTIVEFKENLRVLLISTLFIVLAARLEFSAIAHVAAPGFTLLAVLVLVVRPASVLAATVGTALAWPERVMLMCMAPRGIVAAAVASVFALRLSEAGIEGADAFVPLTFLVIAGTIVVYALPAAWIARQLGVAGLPKRGLLFVGAGPWVRAVAGALQEAGVPVRLVDSNFFDIRAARMEGLPATYTNVLSESLLDELDLDGIGRVLIVTANEEVNTLAAVHFREQFDRSAIYQLATDDEAAGATGLPSHLRGRPLFGRGVSYRSLAERFAAGAVVKTTPLTDEFGFEDYRSEYGDAAIPLFVLDPGGSCQVVAADAPLDAKAGRSIVSLIDPAAANGGGAERSTRTKEKGPA